MCSRYNRLNKHFTKYTVYKIKERYQFEDVVSLLSMCYLASRLCRPIPCLLYPLYLFELRVKVHEGGDEVDVESNIETNPPPGSLLQTREVERGWQC